MQTSSASPGQTESSRQTFPDVRQREPARHDYVPRHQKRMQAGGNNTLTAALGWLSLGIGVAHLLAPRAVARATGVIEQPALLRAIGMREIASGLGILSQRRPAGWLWTRVAGDAMDLALLSFSATRSVGPRRNRVAMTTAAVAGVTVLDVLSSVQQTELVGGAQDRTASGAVSVEKSVTINRSADECYRYWRDFQNLPRFMEHLESVQVIDDKRSHWKAKAPIGASVEWDAEVTVDQPGQLLAWHSVEGADVDNAGTVRFERAPGGRGTIVLVELQYSPPGGKAGAFIARLLGEEPAQQIDDDLRHFKQLIETGEVPTTAGQPSGTRGPIARLLRKGASG
ncbi:MAG: SRPBCC family protein [Pseudomonadota bacterium]